jgi:hypothetical protein
MMADVYITTYEMVAAAAEKAAEHFDRVKEVRAEWWAFAKECGAQGFRPGHYGMPPSGLLFAGEPPQGWRVWARAEKGMTEARPHKGSKRGKEVAAALALLTRAPDDADLCAAFGWGHSPTDGRSLYFATVHGLELPAQRYFMRLPRFPDDAWEPPAGLIELPESEYMRAVEAHNTAVRALRAEAA